MNNEIRLAMLYLAVATGPALALDAMPDCGTSNFDEARNVYTIVTPRTDTVNQQCFITVYSKGGMPTEARNRPASYLAEGRYIIELSGGGGGGGGGRSDPMFHGGGGGGAGAAVTRSVQYLAPGVYKLTIGTGGLGGSANGGAGTPGNPTSIVNANNGQLVAGFAGADTWSPSQFVEAGSSGGRGGLALSGGSGSDGASNDVAAPTNMASADTMLPTAGFTGMPAGARGRTGQPDIGNLGSGGGGGHGGVNKSEAGGNGGHGYIRLIALPAMQ